MRNELQPLYLRLGEQAPIEGIRVGDGQRLYSGGVLMANKYLT